MAKIKKGTYVQQIAVQQTINEVLTIIDSEPKDFKELKVMIHEKFDIKPIEEFDADGDEKAK